MFAVIKTGGKQYRVAADDQLDIDRITGEVGDIVEIGHVLAWGDGDDSTIGAPFVDGASVAAEIVKQGRAPTVIAFKKRRRQNSRRTRGHRQLLTTVRISEILTGGAKPSRKAAPKAAKAADKPVTEKPVAETGSADTAVSDVALIDGIGPALKKKLATAGITSLADLAALDDEAAAKLDAELKLGGRIARDEWVEQAKELLAGKAPRAKVDREAADTDGE